VCRNGGGGLTPDPLILTEPLSFWGGLDPATGRIVDVHHPQHGESLAGRVVVMPHGRGSSSSPSVLAEALRLGNGPAAIKLSRDDPLVWLGAYVAELLYGVKCSVVSEESASGRLS